MLVGVIWRLDVVAVVVVVVIVVLQVFAALFRPVGWLGVSIP